MSVKTETKIQEVCLIRGAVIGISLFYVSTLTLVGVVLWHIVIA